MRLRSWIPVGLILLLVVGIKGVADLQLDAMLAESLHEDQMARGNAAVMEHYRPAAAPAETPSDLAFRGAEGYGRNALSECRDSAYYGPDGVHGNADDWPVNVYIVDPATYGSASDADGAIQAILRDSLSATAYDFVIFTQGGMVRVRDSDGGADASQLTLDTKCTYLSAAPAQGDGPPVLRSPYIDRTVSFRIAPSAEVTHIVVRDVKVWADSGGGAGSTPAFSMRQCSDCVMDHMSIIGGPDQHDFGPAVGALAVMNRVTIGYTLFGPTMDWPTNSTLMLLDATAARTDSTKDLTFLRDYWVHGRYRQPKLSAAFSLGQPDSAARAKNWELINTLSMDIGNNDRQMALDHAVYVDVINSVIKNGMDKTVGGGAFRPIDHRRCNNSGVEMEPSSIHLSGVQFIDPGGTITNYDVIATNSVFNCGRGSTIFPDSLRRANRIANSDSITAWATAAVDDSLFDGSPRVMVGASRQLTCGGTFGAVRDSVDLKLVNYFKNMTYLGAAWLDSLDAGWGWIGRDTLLAGTVCPDTDNDGLPDSFETWSDVMDADSMLGGYFAIEIYLNGDSAWLADLLLTDAGIAPTWGARYVRRVPAKDSIDEIRGVDTLDFLWTDPDSVPDGISSFFARDTQATLARVLAITCDSVEGGSDVLGEADADDTATVMGLSPQALRVVSVPGCP